jgi:hypothetical protein
MLSENDLIFLGASMLLGNTTSRPSSDDIEYAVKASKELYNKIFNEDTQE